MLAFPRLRRFSLQAALALLSTQLVILPIPLHPGSIGHARADAATVSADSESFNFTSQSASTDEASTASASANALKQRTSPVSASGAFPTTIPIDLPPGRSGLTPSLALSYTSDAFRQDSPVGAGWSFGVPSLARDTSEGFPPLTHDGRRLRYDDDKTAFTGPAGRLVSSRLREGLATTAGSRLFVPEREFSPVRFEYVQTEDRWVEHLPSGLKRYYGQSGSAQARITDELGTHSWLLLKERDPDGNTIDYEYHFLDGIEGQARPSLIRAQAYPILKAVRWGGNESANIPHLFRLAVQTQPYAGRLDLLNGHTLLTAQVTHLDVYGPGAGQERLYWQYKLSLSESADTFRHLLRSVTRTGFNLQTGAVETALTKRFAYSGNGLASFKTAGLLPAADKATRAAYSGLMPLAGDGEIYRSGVRLERTTVNGRPRFEKAHLDEFTKLQPMEQLSPEYRGAGYRFEDIDADGDVDVLYNPTGIGTPASRLLLHKSYLNRGQTFSQVLPKARNRESFRGISGGLLISSLADVDGDSDPDAVSFPLRWAKPYAYATGDDFTDHYSTHDDPFDLARFEGADWISKRIILWELLHPWTGPDETACSEGEPIRTGDRNLAPRSARAPAFGPLPLKPSLPGFGTLIPVKPSLPEVGMQTPVGTQDPEDRLPHGDPMLDITYRLDTLLGICSYRPWYIRSNPKPVHRGPLRVRVAYNTSAQAGASPPGLPMPDGSRELTVQGWPSHAVKQARWVIGATMAELNCSGLRTPSLNTQLCGNKLRSPEEVEAAWEILTKPSLQTDPPLVVWNAEFVQRADFHAPLADVNADGRADIVLLKTSRIAPGKTYTSFAPNVYLADHTGFAPEQTRTEALAIDVTRLLPRLLPPINWAALTFRGAYQSAMRPSLSVLKPGPSLRLPDSTLAVLPEPERAAVTDVLAAFRRGDHDDPNLALGLQTAVLSHFDHAVDTAYPGPKVTLRELGSELLRDRKGWFGDWSGLSPTTLPDLELDLSQALIAAGDRTYLSLPALVDAVVSTGNPAATAWFRALLKAAMPELSEANLAELFPSASPQSGFTASALAIFNAGRDIVCDHLDSYKTCARVPTYPIEHDFNAFMFDANGDGLPDMVAAHPPGLVPHTVSPGSSVDSQHGFWRACGAGHAVHLNRGYRWERPREAADQATLPVTAAAGQDGWSTESTLSQDLKRSSERDHAFSLLNQRNRECKGENYIEIDFPAGADQAGVDRVDPSPSWPIRDSPPAFAGLPMSAASFADVNADGLTDVVFAAITRHELVRRNDPQMLEQFIFLNTGRGFVRAVAKDPNALATLDDDLRLAGNVAWRGLPGDFYMTQYIRNDGNTLGTQDRARLVDIDSDGLLDVVYRGECQNLLQERPCSIALWRRNLRKVPDLLTRIDDISGAWTEVDYVAANSGAGRAVVQHGEAQGSAPTGLMVASEVRSGASPIAKPWADVDAGSALRIKLHYENYVREQGSKRALGFEKVTATFGLGIDCTQITGGVTSCIFTDISINTNVYNVAQDARGTSVAYPLRGTLRSEHAVDLTGPSSEQLTSYEHVVSALGTAARIRGGRATSKTRDGPHWLIRASEPGAFDSLGYPQTELTGRANELGTIIAASLETRLTRTTYAHRLAEWRLGLRETVTVEGDRVDALSGERTRGLLSKTFTQYDDAGRVRSHSVLQDGGSDCTDGREQWSTNTFPSYNAAGLPLEILDRDTLINLTYDSASLYVATRSTTVPATPSSPAGPTLEEGASYDLRFGSVSETRDMNGRATERAYDSRGRLLTVMGPDDLLLERHRYEDTEGAPSTRKTDTFTTASSSFSTWTAFDGAGQVLATNQQVSGSVATRLVRNQFDGLGRLAASYQPNSIEVSSTYGLTNLKLEATALATRTTYDGFDRMRSQTLPDGRLVEEAYDNVDVAGTVFARQTTTNPRKLKSLRLFDAQGALVALERLDASNRAALAYSYGVDGARRIVSIADKLGTRRIGYDEGGRLRAASLAFQPGQVPRLHTYCYDTRAKLTSALTPAGRQVSIARDALGRVSRVESDFEHGRAGQAVVEATAATFYYDCSAAEGSLGKLCDRTDDAGSTHITYDVYGRPNRYETTLADVIARTLPAEIPNWYGVTLSYGQAGQLESTTVEGLGTSAHRVSYAHDLNARTNGISVTDGATTRPLVKAATYDAFGRLKSATLGNNVVSAWDMHLASGRLTAQRMVDGTRTFAELRYPLAEYDANGNIGREQRLADEELVSEKVHTYDALDQLASSTLRMEGAERKNERFAFTQGNLTSVVGTGRTDTYTYGDASNTHAVKTIDGPRGSGYQRTITYDTDGWVSRDVESRPASGGLPATTTDRTLAFDAGGCMREAVVRETPANEATRTTTTRNICGLSASRAYRETTFPDAHVERVYYLPDGSELRPDQNLFVMQLPVATSTTATLAWALNTGAIVHEESGYIHTDMRGSVVARTQLSASNATVPSAKAEYGVWGDTLAYSGVQTPRYQFTNEEPDPGTGYYYFGARPYDPTLRRWLAPDALLMGDLELDAYAGEQLNLYAYAANNPVLLTDKNGQYVEAGVEAVSIGLSVKAISDWDSDTSMLDKVMDVGSLGVDVVAAIVPIIPGCLGILRQAATKADDVVDVAKGLDKIGDAKDAASVGGKAADAGKAADGAKAADGTGGAASTKPSHGNTANDAPATRYEKYDKDSNFEKHGTTKHDDPRKRYSDKEIDGGKVVPKERGPRKEILAKERNLTETKPGPKNREPWAGKRDPTHPNYDPNYKRPERK